VTGSHHVFKWIDEDGKRHRVVVPLHGNQVKPVYVKQIIDLIDALFPLEESRRDLSEDDDDE
jgi:hypothetical protein